MMLGSVFGIRWLGFYLTLGVVVWLAFLQSGIHATIAGVLVALTVPARYDIDEATFLTRARTILQRFEAGASEVTPMMTNETQQSAVLALEKACEQVQAPLQKLEHILHIPVQFLIVPLFALANAGVPLSLSGVGGEGMAIGLGIILGLLLGKPLGLLAASWLVVRLRVASLPDGVSWAQMLGAGVLAGIGFTMSLFIATLSFGEGSEFTHAAKLAIFTASLLAGSAGFLLLSRTRAT
jgi:NhaA family Na+:H+ antiporter